MEDQKGQRSKEGADAEGPEATTSTFGKRKEPPAQYKTRKGPMHHVKPSVSSSHTSLSEGHIPSEGKEKAKTAAGEVP